ncbi:MAG: hypothetical protein D3905_01590 [Candidatus Electrothrix sp. AS4_5]|nr:hypothetical protein [Candidatus Electrothrix gigas]
MKQDVYLPQSLVDVDKINITYEGIETKWTKMTPRSLRKKVDQIREYTQSDPQRAIQEISIIYLKHTELPVLNSYLSLSYQALGDFERAEKIILKNYMSFPRYLFAKTNYAHSCLRQGNLDQIKEIFEHTSGLQSLYPRRKVFHFTEFLAFMSVWSVYYDKIGDKKTAILCYRSMKIVDADHPMTKNTQRSIRRTWFLWLLEKIVGKKRLDNFFAQKAPVRTRASQK